MSNQIQRDAPGRLRLVGSREGKKLSAQQGMAGHVFATLTADQAEAWIDSNVTDLASAKQALKYVARAIIYLRDQTEVVE